MSAPAATRPAGAGRPSDRRRPGAFSACWPTRLPHSHGGAAMVSALPLLALLAGSGALPRAETGLDPALLRPLHTMLPAAVRSRERPCSPGPPLRGGVEASPTSAWLRGRSTGADCVLVAGGVHRSLRLAGGGSGLEWIERRLNSVFSSTSKASGSPSGGENAQDNGDIHHSDRTPDVRKLEAWGRFDRAFDSLQTDNSMRKHSFHSMSPISSPEGPQQPAHEQEGSSRSRAAPKMASSWFSRRLSDAFASDAASPADASLLSQLGWSGRTGDRARRAAPDGASSHDGSHATSSLSSAASRASTAGPQAGKLAPSPRMGESFLRLHSPLQQGSELSEEAGGGDATECANAVWRGSSVDDSFTLKMHRNLKSHSTASDSVGRCSVDDIGLPTPLRAEWGPALNAAQNTGLDAGWELPSISFALQDVAAAVI